MSGDPILLLHGQPGRARDWNRVIAALGSRTHAIALERPGWNGRSTPTGLEGNASAAIAALDARQVRRATVVGHSFGGAVAAWLAAQHPERVAALVLAAPSANVASLYWLDRALAAPVAGDVVSAAAFVAAGAALAASPVRRAAARISRLEDRELRAAGRLFLEPSIWHAFSVEQRALVRELPALEQRLGQIAAPTTILAGSADWVVPLSSAQALAEQIPDAKLALVGGAGHLLPLRHAERLAEAILAADCRSG